MNEILQQKLADAIEAAQSTGKDVYTFIAEQSPELAQDIVNWGIYYNGIICAISLAAFLCVVGITLFTLYKIKNDEKWEDLFEDSECGMLATIFVIVFGLVGPLISLGVLMEHISGFIQAVVAPKLYLLTYLKDLIG